MRRAHFQSDHEQEHDDAEFGDVQYGFGMGEPFESERTDEQARREIAEHRAESKASEQRHHDDGRAEQCNYIYQIARAAFDGHGYSNTPGMLPTPRRRTKVAIAGRRGQDSLRGHDNKFMSTPDLLEQSQLDTSFMSRALELARTAEAAGEVPVGAVIVKDGAVIAEGWNRPISTHDPSAHAEMIAMRAAAQTLRNYRLLDTTLYVTLEPCAMCAGAMVHARVKRLVFAATDPRAGAVGSIFNIAQHAALNHRLEVHSGVMAEECAVELRKFFAARRSKI
jgi:tRNA(adenine34) deaminase